MFKNKLFKAPLLALAILLLAVASHFIDPAVLGYDDTLYLSLIILQLLILALPAVFYAKTAGPGYSLTLKLGPIPPSRLWLTLTSLVVLLSGSTVIRLTMSYMGVTDSLFGDYSSIATVSMASVTDVIYVVIAMAIVPAICEEFAFRAVLLTEYRGCGMVTAITATSLLSAFFRFSPSLLPIFFFNGVILAFTVCLTNSLLSAALLHAAFNIFNLFFEKYILRIITQNEYATLSAFILISVFLLSLVLAFSEAERIYNNEALLGKKEDKTVKSDAADDKNGEDDEDGEDKPSGLYLTLKELGLALVSPSFLCCLAVFLFGWLMS